MKIVHLSTTPAREVITAAISTLKSGGLVVYPTETTYGIGADATNQKAVDKLLQYKKRREGKPLSIAVFDQSMAEIYVELNAAAKKVYTTFLPGPITVVSKSKGNVAKGVTSETGALGIRIPNYPLILQLIKAYGKPIAFAKKLTEKLLLKEMGMNAILPTREKCLLLPLRALQHLSQ